MSKFRGILGWMTRTLGTSGGPFAQSSRRLEQLQDELAKRVVESQSGAGIVRVTANCGGSVQNIQFDDELMTLPKESVEHLTREAVNDALRKAREIQEAEEEAALTEELGKLMGPAMQMMSQFFGGKGGGPTGGSPGGWPGSPPLPRR